MNDVEYYNFTRQTLYAKLLEHRDVHKDSTLILLGH